MIPKPIKSGLDFYIKYQILIDSNWDSTADSDRIHSEFSAIHKILWDSRESALKPI
jgi:hypothetical protein